MADDGRDAALTRVETPPVILVPVTSSNVLAVGYCEKPPMLVVQFKAGAYAYPRVPRVLFDALLQAPSKGKFINILIKPAYPVVKLTRIVQALPLQVHDTVATFDTLQVYDVP